MQKHRLLGKWKAAGTPHSNWEWVTEYDLGARSKICEMCEFQTIRYVHVLKHHAFDRPLEVGRECASSMESDSGAAGRREKRLKSLAGRRLRWRSLEWETSAKGNPCARVRGGFIVVLCTDQKGWYVCLIDKQLNRCHCSKERYQTREECGSAAFYELISVQRDRDKCLL